MKKHIPKIAVGIVVCLIIAVIIITVLFLYSFQSQVPSPEAEKDDTSVTFDFNAGSVPSISIEEKITDADYCETIEDALQKQSAYCENEEVYIYHIDEIIKKFENENYISIFYRAVKNKDAECFNFVKFKKKKFNGIEKYVYITGYPSESRRNDLYIESVEETVSGQLGMSDYMQKINIDPHNTRFIYGNVRAKKIYNLKVEGQKPDEIIPYKSLGRQWYFWYYKDLESKKAGTKLKFSLSD